jgi:carboxypeptidase Taq
MQPTCRNGAGAARQSATLSKLVHEKSVDPQLGKLLDALEPHAGRLPQDSDDASLIRVARRDFEKAIKVPAEYVARASAFGSTSYDAWTRARPANDFATMRPFLEMGVDLGREYAGFFAPYANIADPLIDGADEGMTTASIRSLFAALREALVPLVRAIAEQPPIDNCCLHGTFNEPAQLDFGLFVAKRIGYDLERGRLDKTHHPFCTTLSAGDVRITTRVDERDIGQSLFSILHEAGHALYEQGISSIPKAPRSIRASAGVHESQSRLWKTWSVATAFWHHFYRRCSASFRISWWVTVESFIVPSTKSNDPHPNGCRRGDVQPSHHDALRPELDLLEAVSE